MVDVKITKAMVLSAVKALVEQDIDAVVATVDEVDVTGADVVAYVDTTLAQMEAKAAKAKERAAEKRADGDALRAEVLSHITDEFQSADQITELVAGEDITKAKVIARLTQLVKSGEVEKAQNKIGDRKVMTYRLTGGVEEAPVEE